MTTDSQIAAEYYQRLQPGAQQAYDSYFIEYTPPPYQTLVRSQANVGPYNAALSAINAVPMSAARQIVLGTLITQLEDLGVLPNCLDRLWIFANENLGQSQLDLAALKICTFPVTPTFTANRGVQGNGTTQWIDAGLNVNTTPSKYTLADGCQGVWIDIAGVGCPIGNEDGAYSNLQHSATNRIVNINGTVGFTPYAPASQTGFWHGQRAGGLAVTGYGNGGLLEATQNQTMMGALSNRNFAICATNHTVPSKFCTSRVCAAWIGRSLTQVQITGLYNALRQYMTAVGVA